MLLDKIRTRFSQEQIKPTLLGLFINPFYFARKGLFENINSLSKYISGRVLDVGCGQKPYERLFNYVSYTGLEFDSPENRKNSKADYFYNGEIFPFNENDFDSIITNEVFEHVFNPDNFLKEINRVLKLNGSLLISVPFVWDEHEQPYDYARYSSFGLKAILEKNGFSVIEQIKSINDIRVVFQLLNGYLYKKTVTNNGYFNLLITLLLIAPFNILGEILAKFLPENNDLYLDNIFIVKKTRNV